MTFENLQQETRDLIAAHVLFISDALTAVLVDLGTVKAKADNSFSDNGYAILIWPPMRGVASGVEPSGIIGLEATIVVRLEVNPIKLKALQEAYDTLNTNPTPMQWVNAKVVAIKSALLDAEPEVGGVKYEPEQDFLELVTLDEGMLAYHLRFNHFVVI